LVVLLLILIFPTFYMLKLLALLYCYWVSLWKLFDSSLAWVRFSACQHGFTQSKDHSFNYWQNCLDFVYRSFFGYYVEISKSKGIRREIFTSLLSLIVPSPIPKTYSKNDIRSSISKSDALLRSFIFVVSVRT